MSPVPPSGADGGGNAQADSIALLADPARWGRPGAPLERVETHAAIVFLAGDRALKLKRATRLPYLDQSTVALRCAGCEAEVRLNRRTAPDLYLGVRRITEAPGGGLQLDGDGRLVDCVVEMRRFDQAALMDRLSLRPGGLTAELMRALADEVAAFHADAEPAADGADAAEMLRLVRVNDNRLRAYVDGVFDPGAVATLARASARALRRCRRLLGRRRAEGRVRHCHGDLHLRNIFVEHGRPVIFDCIEFDPRLARTDVMYDLAFLLMDLWHRGHRGDANLVLNRYLLRTGDHQGLAPMPFFLSLRAAIRAHVSATMAETAGDAAAARRLHEEARAYLELANSVLAPRLPRLIGVGGLSGSGKSTLALALAPELGPVPGAVVLRSDELRKHLCGVAPEQRLGPEAYAPEVSRRVYAALRDRAGAVLDAGYSAIVDAVHNRADSRDALAAVAAARGRAFVGLWLDAPASTMAARIRGRRADASDATVAVLESQRREPCGRIDWTRLEAGGDLGEVVARSRAALAAAGGR